MPSDRATERPCWRRSVSWLLACLMAAPGCQSAKQKCSFYDSAAAQVCYEAPACAPSQLKAETPNLCSEDDVALEGPEALDPNAPIEYLDMSLEEAIQHALQNTRVLRDLGGVISTPSSLEKQKRR